MKPSAFVFALLGTCAGGAWAQGAPGRDGVPGAAMVGAVGVGRQFKLEYAALAEVADPFHGGMADAGAGAASANRAWGVALGIGRGRWTIRAAHQNRNFAPAAPAMPMGNNLEAKNSILAADVRIGAATAYAAYSISRGRAGSPLFNPDNPYGAAMAATPSSASRDVLVGLALPCGATTLLASFIRKNERDRVGRDAAGLAFGATYAVSRRTDFYASYSRIGRRNGAGYAAGDGAALNLGMRRAF